MYPYNTMYPRQEVVKVNGLISAQNYQMTPNSSALLYDYISNQIGLSERAREGDEIAEALIGHINFQMSELNKRYISM